MPSTWRSSATASAPHPFPLPPSLFRLLSSCSLEMLTSNLNVGAGLVCTFNRSVGGWLHPGQENVQWTPLPLPPGEVRPLRYVQAMQVRLCLRRDDQRKETRGARKETRGGKGYARQHTGQRPGVCSGATVDLTWPFFCCNEYWNPSAWCNHSDALSAVRCSTWRCGVSRARSLSRALHLSMLTCIQQRNAM